MTPAVAGLHYGQAFVSLGVINSYRCCGARTPRRGCAVATEPLGLRPDPFPLINPEGPTVHTSRFVAEWLVTIQALPLLGFGELKCRLAKPPIVVALVAVCSRVVTATSVLPGA